MAASLRHSAQGVSQVFGWMLRAVGVVSVLGLCSSWSGETMPQTELLGGAHPWSLLCHRAPGQECQGTESFKSRFIQCLMGVVCTLPTLAGVECWLPEFLAGSGEDGETHDTSFLLILHCLSHASYTWHSSAGFRAPPKPQDNPPRCRCAARALSLPLAAS